MHTVYLAGPIAGRSGSQACAWREYAQSCLGTLGIRSLSPMRNKHALRFADRISTDFHDYKDLGHFYTAKGIMARDFGDVQRADALLVNLLGCESVSIGTVMELAWAYQLRKPVVVAMEKEGNPHDRHPMVAEAIPFRVETLADAIDAVAVILA